MPASNHTTVTYFILLGLTDRPELQSLLFVMILLIYVVTLASNLGMIGLITTDFQLQTPMYFFLVNLSIVDLCYSSVFVPRMLVNFLVENKTISYSACVTQHFLFVVFVTTEGFLLAVMAYDRYIAICSPLLYTTLMPRKVCICLVVGSYLGGLFNSLVHTCGLLKLSFCGPNTINHYFCDTNPLLQLTCSENRVNELVLVTLSGIIAMSTLLIVIVSYIYILFSALSMGSATRYKAFSTCASHLMAVTLFYGPVSLSHVQPSSGYSLDREKISAVFYTLAVPMLNPLIYSLRNKEVKNALRRVMERKKCCSSTCLSE
ncbi:olfactory receptor 1052-like [Oxyura jamaicensis]|uniref:olfactory receptor 1052-like n=1 Tax=Oxyura jamaicensis TaxID=8884 RepID=UPI0015A6F4F7|nr:olfactory receptor 1052-like [Oxyura jamaicensis]